MTTIQVLTNHVRLVASEWDSTDLEPVIILENLMNAALAVRDYLKLH
jgi:hypothetical protein